MTESGAAEELQRLTRELDNFQSIAKYLVPLPGEVPRLSGTDAMTARPTTVPSARTSSTL